MFTTVPAVVRNGRIELLEQTDLPEGGRLLVTVLADDEQDFWLRVSESALSQIWDNPQDDVYAEAEDSRSC